MRRNLINKFASILVLVFTSISVYVVYFAHEALELLGNSIWVAFAHVNIALIQLLMILEGVVFTVWLWTKKTPK